MLTYLACLISFALGAFLFLTSINGYMTDDLKSLNKMAKDKQSESDIFNQFSIFIRAHANIKQLSSLNNYQKVISNSFNSTLFRLIMDFSDIYQTTLMLDFGGGTITLSISMLLVQLEIVKCNFIYMEKRFILFSISFKV